MVVPWTGGAYLSADSDEMDRLRHWVEDLGVGGVIVSIGPAGDVALRLNLLQSLADVPLLVGTDMEHGPGQRLDAGTLMPYGWDLGGGTDFPPVMGLGAAGDPALAENMGRITAVEARAVGIHWDFAPVVDVNIDPANPIINVRSYGERPELVSRMAAAHARGLQAGGMIATAKHFPGHGDVTIDSHIEMPLLSIDRARLDAVELVPYRALVDAGVAAVMSAHIAFPALTGDSVPATLNRRLLTDLLRDELGFDGLIITDALDMGALVRRYGQAEAGVLAVEAGADVLLQPLDVEAVISAVAGAVRAGRVDEARIDASVRRILSAKAALGLARDRYVDAAAIPYRVGGRAHRAAAETAAARSITVARNRTGLLPIRGTPDVLHVLYSAYADPWAGRAFHTALSESGGSWRLERLVQRADSAALASIAEQAASADLVLVSFFVPPRAGAGNVAMPTALADALAEIARERPVVAVSFGNPYLLTEIPDVGAYALAWGGTPLMQRAAADALLGRTPVDATLPISIPPLVPAGQGERLGAAGPVPERAAAAGSAAGEAAGTSAARLPRASAAEAAMDEAALARADSIILAAIADGVTPGAALAVGRRGRLVRLRGYGHTDWAPGSAAVDEHTLYDLASLTKVVATTAAVMELVEQGRLELDARVSDYLPQFADTAPAPWTVSDVEQPDAPHGPLLARDAPITVRHLLTHTAGLPAWRPFFRERCGSDDYVQAIAELPLESMPGERREYSDPGVILLGRIVEAVSGEPLDAFVRRAVFRPAGMAATGFRPAGEPPVAPAAPGCRHAQAAGWAAARSVAPTERDTTYRRALVRGHVHDENAYAMGGVAGHAGLFSSASDLAVFAQTLLDRGVAPGGTRVFDAATVDAFTRPGAARVAAATHDDQRLGWHGRGLGSSAGDLMSARAFGHTGFTGTSIWIDPERELFVVLLTNRVNPTRERGGHTVLRRAVHDAIGRAIVD